MTQQPYTANIVETLNYLYLSAMSGVYLPLLKYSLMFKVPIIIVVCWLYLMSYDVNVLIDDIVNLYF